MLLSILSATRYPSHAARNWQAVFAEVETQHPTENNCAVFSAWNVLAVILRLRTCDNNLERVLRLRWFPFLVWAIGGSDLTLRSRNRTSVYAPNHSRVKTALQGFYDMARLETAVISRTLTEDLPERFLDVAKRSHNAIYRSLR